LDRTGLVYHEGYLRHDPGSQHPESPERLRRTVGLFQAKNIMTSPKLSLLKPDPAVEEDLLRVHSASYIEKIRSMSKGGSFPKFLTMDTPVQEGTFDLAKLSAGGAILAGKAVVEGRMKNAFALIRPPGHHAGRDYGGGFCYFNNIAIMIEYLREKHRLKRFMILDWDVHHGNGTQDVFYRDPTVVYFSTHQMPLYPGTGYEEELGAGEGKGYKINIPLQPGTSGLNYPYILEELFEPIAKAFKPEIIAVSAGQDAYFADPIANLKFTIHTYVDNTSYVMRVAERVCEGRVAMVLEGGYHLEAVPHAILGIVTTLANLKDVEITEPYPTVEQPPSEEVRRTVKRLKSILAEYWGTLK